MSDVNELAKDLEESRAVRLLAEWLAISHHETRLERNKYIEEALELHEYIVFVIGFSPAEKPQ